MYEKAIMTFIRGVLTMLTVLWACASLQNNVSTNAHRHAHPHLSTSNAHRHAHPHLSTSTPAHQHTPAHHARPLPGSNSTSSRERRDGHVTSIEGPSDVPWGRPGVCDQCEYYYPACVANGTVGLLLYCDEREFAEIPEFADRHSAIAIANFKGNAITIVRTDSFLKINNTVRLWLAQNQITRIETGAFHSLVYMEELQLQENRISDLQPRAFASCYSVFSLFLWDNLLSTIEASAFEDLQSITFFRLNNNDLTSIEKGAFKEMSAWLEYLYLVIVPPTIPVFIPPNQTCAQPWQALTPFSFFALCDRARLCKTVSVGGVRRYRFCGRRWHSRTQRGCLTITTQAMNELSCLRGVVSPLPPKHKQDNSFIFHELFLESLAG